MRALLIDPYKELISVVDVKDSCESISTTINCEWITLIRLDAYNSLWLDMERLLKSKDNQATFIINDNIYVGYGLILGNDYEEMCNCNLTLEEIRDMVEFD